MINIISGDLLEAKEQYIAHQANCVSSGAAGLAYYLFEKYPYANIYAKRTENSIPGTIDICGDDNNRYIINMFSQYFPGKAGYGKDSRESRLGYFKACLQHISNISGLESIAFPFGIGCGLAGGKWEDYLLLLEQFADFNKNVKVSLYKK